MKMQKEEKIKIAKYVIGSVFAILLGVAAEVQYAYAAGILALLTIQDTKKETLYIAIKRFVVFLVMTGLSVVIFPRAGYHVWAFGIVLIPYLIFCISFDMKEAMTPIAVLCTHYIAAGSCSIPMIINEFLVLLIGVGSGILVNLFMPNRQKWLRQYQNNVDEKMIHILKEMSAHMKTDDKSENKPECFDELESILEELKK